MSRTWTLIAVFAVMLALVPAASAQQPIQYIYDDLGRLVGVVDPAADTAVYSYDAVGDLLSIARFASSTVSIIAFSPGSGPVGATVTISGTGFSTTPGQNAVTFNGTAATVTRATATRLVTTVPSGATTGTIAVTSPSGSAASSGSFTVTASSGLPTITSFTPAVAMPGDSTTITGTNYETTLANDRVAFNVTRPMYGRVTSATTTSLNVIVPVGATSGRISVTTPGGKAASTADFFVPPPGQGYTAAHVVFTGRIAVGGSSVTVTIPTANKIGMLVFDATAGQRLSLGFTSIGMGTSVFIYKPDGTLLTSFGVTFPASALDMDPLPMTGTYTIVVALTTSSVGNVTLTLSEEVTGTLIVGGSALPVSIPRAGQRARIAFTGTAGQRLDLGITTPTFSGTASVVKPDGTLLGSPQTFGADSALDTVPPLPVSGTYAILVDPLNANTGTVTLILSEEIAGTITVDGAAAPVTIGRAGQQARLSFTGTAGQRLSIGLTSITVPSGWISFLNPDGSTLLAPQFFGSFNTAFNTSALATSGTYTILVDPSAAATGGLTLTLSTEVTASITPDGPSVPLTISRAGQRARLTFSGTAGGRVSVNVMGSTLGWAFAELFNPNGSSAGWWPSFSGASAFMEPKTTATSGTYAVVIDPDGVGTGSLTVALYTVPPDVAGTLTVNGAAQTVTTTAPGQKGVLTFTGTASQQYTVWAANSTQGCVTLFVLRPDGATQNTASCAASYSRTATSSTSGTFTVTVDPSGTNTGSVEISVTNP